MKLEMKVLEEAEKAAKIKNKEKLIDDLMFGDADANQILADHRWTGDGIFWNGEFIVEGCWVFLWLHLWLKTHKFANTYYVRKG